MTPPVGEGDEVEVEVGAPAHGGHCVARYEGQVIFVRHALPGERVLVEITEVHKGYLRGDAVDVLVASPERVTPGCGYAHPNGCGGCDLQHASPKAQAEWKQAVVQEQLARLADIHLQVSVEQPTRLDGWRTRVRYTVDGRGRAGLLKHRSHEVVPVDRCAIAHPSIQALDVLRRQWPDADTVDVVAPSTAPAQIVQDPPQKVVEHAAGRDFTISAAGFWQGHPESADTLVGAVLDYLRPEPGERAWDLYGGAGLFAAALALRGCKVTLVEAAVDGAVAALDNLKDLPVTVIQSTVERARLSGPVDLVVLDPPRTGAGARVVRAIAAAAPRAVAYVACDPAALARDLRTFGELGYRLAALRAFDLFPQTHHVECVAHLVRA